MDNANSSNTEVPDEITPKGAAFRGLNESLPINEYNLPDFVYRADLIPADISTGSYSPRDRMSILQSATVQLTFDHGYPAVDGTTPFWERMPAEHDAAYDAFVVFLELPESTNCENPIRLLPLVAQITKIDISQIATYCHVFYWHWRARAYDLFLIAAHKKQREQRVMSIEGKHFRLAEEQLEKVLKISTYRLDSIIRKLGTDDDDDDTKLKELFDIQERLVKIQRMSVGLPANGPSQIDLRDTTPRHATVQETLKSISKDSTGEASPTRRSRDMDALLESPDDLMAAQALLLKMSGGGPLAKSDGTDIPESGLYEPTRPTGPVRPLVTFDPNGEFITKDSDLNNYNDVEDLGNPDD